MAEPGADARAQRDELFAAQLLEQARVAGEHDAQQRLGIEACAGEQAQFREHGGAHLLRFVDEEARAAAGGSGDASIQRSRSTLKPPQRLCGSQRHAEDIADLAVEVRQVALRVVDDADGEVGQARQALGE